MRTLDVTMDDVYAARRRIAAVAVRTPLIASSLLTEAAVASVHLKAESLQKTGSFKIRGAANKILSLTAEQKDRGVITVSSGNHGLAVAYVARELGIHAVICMSARVPDNKVDAIKAFGGETVIHGDSYEEAEVHALGLARDRGLVMVPPFDDPLIIAGQGTIGLELLENFPEVDTVVVPLSGGGLISGIALAVKSAKPAIRVIGVSMDRAPVMYHSLKAGAPIDMPEEPTIADALVGNIGLNNRYTFRMVQEYVDEVVLVSEEEIAEAMAFALKRHNLVTEGGGAVGIAALQQQKLDKLGDNVAVVVTGSNVDLSLLQEIASGTWHD
jgi:threonine dehydratase